MTACLDKLCKVLGYKFDEPRLLTQALTHRSSGAQNNERLEFLGDSILNFTITQALFQRFPTMKEGKMSQLRAKLVRGETLAQLAKGLNLGEYLRLGIGEMRSGGYQRASILADTLEAVIAAVYLDAGLDVCNSMILNWFAERLDNLASDDDNRDAKTQLQEFLQSLQKPLPCYTVFTTEGKAHEQTFFVRCEVEGVDFSAEGEGHSRRRAEQAAAELFLTKFKQSKLI